MRNHRRLICTLSVCLFALLALSGCGALSLRSSEETAVYRTAMLPQAQTQLDLIPNASRYEIDLRVDTDRLAADGHQTVRYFNNQTLDLNEVYFRLYPNLPAYGGDLQVSHVQVDGREVQAAYEAERSALRVPLPFTLRPGQPVRIALDFHLTVQRHEQNPTSLGESEGILTLPNFYPLLAVCQHGRWDTSVGPGFADAVFSDIGLYQVTLDVPHDMVVASTGSVVSEGVTAEGRRIIRTVSGPVREFGLVMSPRFAKQSLSARGIDISSYYLPEDAAAGRDGLWRAAAAVQVFSDVFSDYPYAKLDVVEAPPGMRSLTLPTLILVGSGAYRTEKDKIEPLVVRETAHQWWYNLVGSDPVNDPAVDEGLAEFSLYYYYVGVYGPRYADKIAQTRWEEPYEHALENGLDAAVEQPAAAFTPENYEPIVFTKSGARCYELRHYIGPDAFDEAVRNYLNSYEYRIAPSGAFLGIASGTTPLSLEEYASKWRQATPGPDSNASE